MEIWFDEAEALVGREVDAWVIDGDECHPFNLGPAAEDVTRVAVDLEFPSGCFEVRNYQLEAYVRGYRGTGKTISLLNYLGILPVDPVFPEALPNGRKCQPWQRRKKGRS